MRKGVHNNPDVYKGGPGLPRAGRPKGVTDSPLCQRSREKRLKSLVVGLDDAAKKAGHKLGMAGFIFKWAEQSEENTKFLISLYTTQRVPQAIDLDVMDMKIREAELMSQQTVGPSGPSVVLQFAEVMAPTEGMRTMDPMLEADVEVIEVMSDAKAESRWEQQRPEEVSAEEL